MSEPPPERPPEEPLAPETPAELPAQPPVEPLPPAPPPPEQPAQPTAPPIEPAKPHPFRLVNSDDLRRSRLTVLVRLLLVIPHAIWLTLYALVAVFVTIFNWFATLITGRPPQWVLRWMTRFLRYWLYVTAYLNLLANPYPPFHGSPGYYPIDLAAPEEPERQHRLVTAFRLILAIPAYILSYVFSQVMQVVAFLAWFVAIVIGRIPRGMENLGLYCLRYQLETWAYMAFLTQRYPSLAAAPPPQ
jgi:Domain of unknown function (DUF4389)